MKNLKWKILTYMQQMGEVFFMDPQNGKALLADYFKTKAGGKASPKFGYTYYRMDNTALRESFNWADVARRA